MKRMHRALAVLVMGAAGCGGGSGAAPPTTLAPTVAPPPTPAAEQVPSADPPIEITPVGRGISVTSENQILLELKPEDLVPANPLDLAGRTLLFTPAGGGYSRSARALDWEEEADDAEQLRGPAEVELEHFQFPFAGREWDSFFFGGDGTPAAITFGKPIPTGYEWPRRFGSMPQLLGGLSTFTPMISALFKPHLDGDVHVSNLPNRVIVSFVASDPWFYVYGRRPKETLDLQIVLHSDGRIALNYGPQPQDPDEAFSDGIVGLFPGVVKTGLLGSIADPEDRSLPGYLDLLETAVYTTTEPNVVHVEFTTRAPIRPLPGQELTYIVEFDVDEPFTDERDDRDLLAGVTVLPDGGLEARWDATGAAFEAHENRIGLLVDLHVIAARSASVSGRSGTTNTTTGSWSRVDGGRSDVVMFPEPTASIDLSQPDSQPSSAQYEAFHYPMIRDGADGVAEVSCRIIEVLGDEFDFMAFNSQFRVDQQSPGPAHGGWGGVYRGAVHAEVDGIGLREDDTTTPCESRLKNSWGYPVWMKARTVVYESYAESYAHDAGQGPYDAGLTQFAHEIGHTWLAYAEYMRNGERRPLRGDGSHWAFGLHAPAPFPWRGSENGSIMGLGGSYWRENGDGTFTGTFGWWNKGGGFSWLDLYLMGLATPDEVPDMFLLHGLKQVGGGRNGTYTAEKEIVTMEQILAANGPRNPPPERSRKVFNTGFVYFLLPGQEPDAELLRGHASYRDRALEHWSHIAGGRGQLTSELPGRYQE